MVIQLFPGCPHFRAETHCCLFSIANDWCFHQTWIVENLVLFGSGVIHVLHVGDFLGLSGPVNEVINAAHSPYHTVKLLAGHSIAEKVNGLIFNPAFLEVAFGLLGVKAFAFSENLNVQYSTSIRHKPWGGARNPALHRWAENKEGMLSEVRSPLPTSINVPAIIRIML